MGASAHFATRRRSAGRGSVAFSEGGGGSGLDVEAVLRRVWGDDDRRENHRHVLTGLARQNLRLFRQLPEILDVRELHRALEPAGTAVVGGEREVPVPAKQVAQGPKV